MGMADDPRQDDPTILPDDRLFRRVPANQLIPEPDGTQRPSSAVFKVRELSVNIESLMIQQGRPPEDTLTPYPGEYLTAVTAGQVRAYGHPIVKDTAPPELPPKVIRPSGSFVSFTLASFSARGRTSASTKSPYFAETVSYSMLRSAPPF